MGSSPAMNKLVRDMSKPPRPPLNLSKKETRDPYKEWSKTIRKAPHSLYQTTDSNDIQRPRISSIRMPRQWRRRRPHQKENPEQVWAHTN